MKNFLFLMVTFSFLFCSSIKAQKLPYAQQQKVDRLFKNSSVVYFKFPVRSQQEIPQFAKIVSVDKANGGMVLAHANKQQFTRFAAFNIAYTVVPGPKKKAVATKKTTTTKTTKGGTTVKKTTTTKTAVKK